jgi:hypothetical protein
VCCFTLRAFIFRSGKIIFPHKAQAEYQLLVYLLALIYGKDSDVGAIHCLIPEQVKCQDACHFANLFEALSAFKECSIDSIKSLIQLGQAMNALRGQIIEVLSLTSKDISKKLNLTFDELKTFSSKAIESVMIDKVSFVDNVENTKRIVKSHQDGVPSTTSAAGGNFMDCGPIRRVIGRPVYDDGSMQVSAAG